MLCTRPTSRHPPRLPGNACGVSLTELLLVLAIATVLLAMAVPSMGAMLVAQKAASLTNHLVSSLHLARGEAIKRNARAVVCKSGDGVQCVTSGGWEQGWIVFHDANNNAQLDEGEVVVRQQGPAGGGLRLRGNLPVANYVSYTASGSAKMTSGAFQAGTFTLCPDVAGFAGEVRQIILGGPGRPRVQKGTAADCS